MSMREGENAGEERCVCVEQDEEFKSTRGENRRSRTRECVCECNSMQEEEAWANKSTR